MEDRDPIKQIQHLLDDPGKVLEKISRIQSALGSLTTSGAATPPATLPPAEAGSIAQIKPDLYGSLLQALRDLRSQIEECLRPLAVQAFQAETERLSEWIKREQLALRDCLTRIDQNLLACVELVEKSQQKHLHLSALKKRLEELGGSSSAIPELSSAQDPAEVINARLERLRRDGKL